MSQRWSRHRSSASGSSEQLCGIKTGKEPLSPVLTIARGKLGKHSFIQPFIQQICDEWLLWGRKETHRLILDWGHVTKENNIRKAHNLLGPDSGWRKRAKSLPSEGHRALELTTLAPRQLGVASPQTASGAPWPPPQRMWSAGSSGSWKGEIQGKLSIGKRQEDGNLPFRTRYHMQWLLGWENTRSTPSLLSFFSHLL